MHYDWNSGKKSEMISPWGIFLPPPALSLGFHISGNVKLFKLAADALLDVCSAFSVPFRTSSISSHQNFESSTLLEDYPWELFCKAQKGTLLKISFGIFFEIARSRARFSFFVQIRHMYVFRTFTYVVQKSWHDRRISWVTTSGVSRRFEQHMKAVQTWKG